MGGMGEMGGRGGGQGVARGVDEVGCGMAEDMFRTWDVDYECLIPLAIHPRKRYR